LEARVSFRDFVIKQLIDVIQWTEADETLLAYRYPMQDMEIQNGGQLTVRESQMALFVNEGRIADVFGPGLYTLTRRNLPVLTDLMNWDKGFESPTSISIPCACGWIRSGARPHRLRSAIRNSARYGCAATESILTASPIRGPFTPM
jgi:hypothetical protein